MRKARIAVVLAAGVAFTLVLPAQARLAKQGTKSTVVFAAKGSGGMTIVGTTSELSVRDDGRTLVFSVPLAKLTTGISLRDKHMREKYLQVGQYPAAELSVDRAQLRPPASGAVSADVSGTMKLHGKTRTVTVHYSAKKNGATIQVVGSTRLNIRDFGIEVPSFLGVTVKPDLDITVSLEVRDSDFELQLRPERKVPCGVQTRAVVSALGPERSHAKHGADSSFGLASCRAPRGLLLGGAALCLLTLWSSQALAFHWMVRHGNTTCSTCHADPSGSGLLTAYGRGLAETELRTRWGKQREEDADPGRIANFMLGAFRMPDWLQLQIDGRHLVLVPASQASRTRYSLMQADGAAHLKLGRFRAAGSLGYAYQGALGASVTRGNAALEHRLIARTYWLGVGLGADEQLVLRAGRLNLPFGLRNIEHTMFVRMATRTNINDQQQVGVALAWNTQRIRAELMVIAGNFQVRPDDWRERGYSGYFEWAPREKLAVGVSSLVTHAALDIELNTALWRQAHGLFARWSPLPWLVASLESNLLFYSQPPAGAADANNVAGNASALLLDFEPLKGLHLLGAAELQNRSIGNATTDYGFWAGVWWFFLPHLDLRADVNWASVGGQGATYVLFQLHGYL